MIRSYAGRFGDAYWDAFDEHARPRLSPAPTIVDLGCGPGLLLQDLSARVPKGDLHGYDLTPAMIEHARRIDYIGQPPTLGLLDLLKDRLPFEEASVDVVAISAVVHLFDDLFPFLAEVSRVLKPAGTFLMYEWVRTSLAEYMGRPSTSDAPESPEDFRRRSMKLFGTHNHYAREDWRWMLTESGFDILGEASPAGKFYQLFIAAPKVSA